MIRELKLTNFMQHRDLGITMSNGLQCLRGQNEAGKSTVLRAISYALFGSRVLPAPLSEIVTWGEAEKSLRVELTIEAEGARYTFVRGKNGAEVILDGNVFVTGQNEVSAFASTLLGADAATADLLMFANQGALRGTLDQGPKATGALLEQLADFDLFDRLLERAQERLALGSSAVYEERLNGLKAQFDQLPAMPEKPDAAAHEAQCLVLQQRMDILRKQSDDMQPGIDAAQRLRDEEAERITRATTLQGGIDTANDEIARHRQALAGTIVPDDVSTEFMTVKVRVEEERIHAQRVAAYQTLVNYTFSENVLDMSLEEATALHKETGEEITACQKRIADLSGDIRVQEALIVKESVCGLCGQDVSKFPQVAEKNAAITNQIAALRGQHEQESIQLSLLQQRSSAIETAIRAQNALAKVFGPISDFFLVDESVTPNVLRWKGEAPGTVTDSKPELLRLEAQQMAREKALAQCEMLEKLITERLLTVTRLNEELKAVDASPERLAQADAALQQLLIQQGTLNIEWMGELEKSNQLNAAFKVASESWEAVNALHARLVADIATVTKQLDDLAFNNLLVKKIRAARPVVTTKLWNLVLSSVSTLFSQLRGEKSVVTRGEDGFMVNGKVARTLSGSTLDVLAIAIRVALVRTFIPHCPLLVVDEPAQGCDTNRTESLIGFLASCGFSQLVLVTHEAISESFADNVIWLDQ